MAQIFIAIIPIEVYKVLQSYCLARVSHVSFTCFARVINVPPSCHLDM